MIFIVGLHVSEPSSNTDFIFELITLILVAAVLSLDLEMLPRALNALQAFPVGDNTCMSSSVCPVMIKHHLVST